MTISAINLPDALRNIVMHRLTKDNVVFVCIGSDRSTGDSLGPIVGSDLSARGFEVFGTVERPVHAMNLAETVERLPKDKRIIAIDACLGRESSVGTYLAGAGPLYPGSGVQKQLPPVGDIHIAGIVNVSGFMEYFVLQNTRLALVIDMARTITDAINRVFEDRASLEVAVTKNSRGGNPMVSTGIVRKVDELGRVVIPIELRRTLGIGEKDDLEIYVDDERIMLKKYAPGCILCRSVVDQMVPVKNKLICKECIATINN